MLGEISESSIKRIQRVNEIGLVPFVDWLLKTQIRGEAISNAVWTELAKYIRVTLLNGNRDAYTKYCTSYSWSVSAVGDVEDPIISIALTCRKVDESLVFPIKWEGRLIITKDFYTNILNKETIIAVDEASGHVITADIIL